MMKNHLTALITSGKTKVAIAFLRKQSLKGKSLKSLNLIEAEFNKLREEEAKGIITFEEKQLRRNRINDGLLSVIEINGETAKSGNWYWLISLLPLIIFGFFWFFNSKTTIECPDFPDDINNKILIVPFENVGDKNAKPHVVLRDKINMLTENNKLSSVAKPCAPIENLSIAEAPGIAEECNANLLIWGNYSSGSDSLRMTLNYFFTDAPERNKLGNMIALKDVTGLQSGQMLKGLDDAIMSLCGIIAVREGNSEVALRWLKSLKKREKIDEEIMKNLSK